MLSKIRVSFRDTIIRLEHLPRDAQTGAAVEIRIARIEYHDDQAVCPGTEKTANHPSGVTDKSQSVYQPAAVAHKNFQARNLGNIVVSKAKKWPRPIVREDQQSGKDEFSFTVECPHFTIIRKDK